MTETSKSLLKHDYKLILHHYIQWSGIFLLNQLFYSKKRIIKLIWLVFTAIITLYFIYYLIILLFFQETVSKVFTRNMKLEVQQFPRLTFVSDKQLFRKEALEISAKSTEYKAKLLPFISNTTHNDFFIRRSSLSQITTLLKTNSKFCLRLHSLIIIVGEISKPENFVVKYCMFAGIKCDRTNAIRHEKDDLHGYSIKFNDVSQFVKRSGRDFGLTVLFHLRGNYFDLQADPFYNQEMFGIFPFLDIRMSIEDPNTFPDNELNYIPISVGHSTSIMIDPKNVIFKNNQGGCAESMLLNNKPGDRIAAYSMNRCIRLCIHATIHKACSCNLFTTLNVRDPSLTWCTSKKELECVAEIYHPKIENPFQLKLCNCSLPCTKKSYYSLITTQKLHLSNVIPFLTSRSSFLPEQVFEQVALVNVYFKSYQLETREDEMVRKDSINFAEISGVVSLLFGISAIDIIGLIFIIPMALLWFIRLFLYNSFMYSKIKKCFTRKAQ